MKEYTAYLFDADGTLLDTKGAILSAYCEMGRVLGERMPDEGVIAGTIGLPLYKQLRVFFGEDRDEGFYDKAGRVYGDVLMSNYSETLRLFPGVAEGLAALRERGKRLAVVTSRRLLSLEMFLETTGIDGYFDLLVTPESTRSHKPDPEPALFAAEGLGVGVGESVFVGDAVFDIMCGKGAGMDAVLVSWGGNDSAGWEVQPDLVVGEFGELLPS